MRPSFRALSLSLALTLAVAGCSAHRRAVEEGDRYAQGGAWADADNAYASALALAPEDADVRLKRREVRRQWSAQLLAQARALAEADLAGRQARLTRAVDVDPDNAEARALLEKTLEARLARAEAALADERLGEARGELDALLALRPQWAQARRARDGVQGAWAKRWFRTAEALEKEGKLGNALLAYARADQERPGATAARERAAAVRQRLRDEVAFSVQVLPLEDRAHAPDVAGRLAPGRLAEALPRKLPVRVVTEAPAAGRPGVRLALGLERVTPQRTQETHQRTQRYQSGTRSVPNPEREQAEASLTRAEHASQDAHARAATALRELARREDALDQARASLTRCEERRLKDCQDALAACQATARAAQADPKAAPVSCEAPRCAPGACAEEARALTERRDVTREAAGELEDALGRSDVAGRDAARAREATQRLPLTREEPMFADFVYDVELHRLSVAATLTQRLEPLEGTAAPQLATQDFTAASEDWSHPGHAQVGVLADPVQLAAEPALRQAAGDEALEDVTRRVMQRFDAYRQARVAEARRGSVRPGADDVVETSVRALLLTQDAPPDDLLLPLLKARGLDKAQALYGE